MNRYSWDLDPRSLATTLCWFSALCAIGVHDVRRTRVGGVVVGTGPVVAVAVTRLHLWRNERFPVNVETVQLRLWESEGFLGVAPGLLIGVATKHPGLSLNARSTSHAAACFVSCLISPRKAPGLTRRIRLPEFSKSSGVAAASTAAGDRKRYWAKDRNPSPGYLTTGGRFRVFVDFDYCSFDFLVRSRRNQVVSWHLVSNG